MNDFRARYVWAIALFGLALTIVVGAVAYNVGVSHGLAQAAVETAATPVAVYRWHGPFGFGFVFPMFFFLFFWLFVWRALWWRPWPRWQHGGPFARESFEEWHRRAHERMAGGERGPAG